MTLYATERIDDAVSLTRSLLLPVSWLWVKLAVVVAFVGLGSGGGGSGSSFVSNGPSTAASAGDLPAVDFGAISIPEVVLFWVAVVVGFVLLVGLVFAVVGAVSEFVLVASLRDQEVHLRRWYREYARRGLRLFGFRLVLAVVALVLVVGSVLGLFWSEISTLLSGGTLSPDVASILARATAVVAVAAVVGIPAAIVHGLTTEFVVPIVLQRNCGILDGWRRFWATLREQPKQYAVYVLVAFGLRIGTGIAAGIVIGILAVLALIPFAILGFAVGFGAVLSGTASTAVLVALGLLALAYAVVVVALSALVYVPVRAFHRYLALLVLGDTDEDLDLISEIRPPLEDTFASVGDT